MKIAIHHRTNSFSDHWLNYCNNYKIPYKIVNCYDSDIIGQLNDCDGLMWHWAHWESKAILFARQLTYALEQSGKKVFPNSRTCWHFDDKLGQKYLFDSLGINAVPTWVFYDKVSAFQWIENTVFPKVFKLRGGAGSNNVKLVRTPRQAKKLVRKGFGKGFNSYDKWNSFNDRISRLKYEKSVSATVHVMKGIIRLFVKSYNQRLRTRDKGYVYFQDFISKNDFDIRLVVVGEHCFGIRRFFRKNDFRASGSGLKDYNHELISTECVKVAFDIAKILNMQSVAFDFINYHDQYKLIEVSYAFVSSEFPGYWDSNLCWQEGETNPQKIMIEEFIKSL